MLGSVTVLLAFAAFWLWLKLSTAQQQNVALQDEIARLRTRLRGARTQS
jgi:hypothetical protein